MSDPTTPEPIPATSSEPVGAQPAAPETVGLQPNIAAVLACFFSLLGGIIFLVLEKKNKFVRFYAMQSVLFGAAGFVVFFILTLISIVFSKIPFIGGLIGLFLWLVSILVGLGFLAVWVLTMVKAFQNTEWEIPYLGKIARKQLVSGPLSKL